MEMFEKWAERTAFGISLVEQAFNGVFVADLERCLGVDQEARQGQKQDEGL